MSSLQRIAWVSLFLFTCASVCLAGTLTGTVSAPHPDKVVVFVQGVTGTFASQDGIIDQKGKVFIPYVLPVLKGATVSFRNDDDLQHNVLGVGADNFNLGSFGKGAIRDHKFTKAGDVTLLCNVHPEMEGHILVLDNPFFTRPDSSGKFEIDKVPAGDYVVVAWYAGKVKKQNVKVPAEGTVSVAF